MNNCCGNCKHHLPMAQDEFICNNESSEGYGLSTSFDDYCGEFKSREERED